MRTYLRTRYLAPLAMVAVLALAVSAWAYFSSTGAGTGTAKVGSSTQIALSSDQVSNLYPGGADVPVTVHVSNPGSGAEFVGTISGTVADNGACLGSWFTVDPITYNADVAGGHNGADATTAVRMADSGTDQDACQGATMTINWSSN
jgi:hypothetical protein